MKMNELFTARYNDGRKVYEKPLEWIYSHRNGASVEVSPCIWLWKASKSNVFFVDYIGDGLSCTLKTFDSLAAAAAYSEEVGAMTEESFEDWLINVRWARKEA